MYPLTLYGNKEDEMTTKIYLPEAEMPTHWYNVVADMPNKPAPYLGPDGNPNRRGAVG